MDPLETLQTSLTGRYNVVREIGQGGMATVFLARDVKHDRHVALKVLRPELGAVLGVERFLSEIKVTANLQHPHLLPLFDSGEANGLLFYVMPFVEGESLRTRLDREHQLPIDEAIRITTAVASALEYAHKQQVIHRDLKPENILMQHGEPVVSDFGIALAVSNAGGARVTQTGLSLGTPQYMSPEQATGDRTVDARSDIYSLAAVLYEMLTGEPPHHGKTAQAIIARVLTEKPNSARLMRDTIPPHVDAALMHALAKLPADRFASAGEFAAALKNPGAMTDAAQYATGAITPAAAPSATKPATPSRVRAALPWAVAVLSLGALILSRVAAPRPAPQQVVRFPMVMPREMEFGAANSPLALSRDGSKLLVGSLVQSGVGLFLRSLNDPRFVPIPGTAGTISATFSPDGSQIAYGTANGIMKVSLNGGTGLQLGPGVIGNGRLSWSDRGEIAFVKRGEQGIWILPASGGEAKLLVRPDTAAGEFVYSSPHWLPGGDAILFTVNPTQAGAEIAVATRDGKVRKLGQRGLLARYVADGHLMVDDAAGSVLSVPFDLRRLAITGAPTPVLQGLLTQQYGNGYWDVSPNGTLVYLNGTSGGNLVAVDRHGATTPIAEETRRYRRPRVSPDGNRVVVEVATTTNTAGPRAAVDLWMIDRAARNMSRFTFGATSMDPLWTRDGKRVVFSRTEKNATTYDLWWQPSDNSGAAEPLYEAPASQWAYGFTPDGKTLIFDQQGNSTQPSGIFSVPVPTGGAKPTTVVATEFTNRLGDLSPDGKWWAYTSNESGRFEVYVRPFPGPGGKWQVSTSGGDQPLWNKNGRELFYRGNQKVMSATVSTSPTFSVTARTPLFDDVYETAGTLNWDVFPDGNRFAMIKSLESTTQLMVAVNWLEELKKAGATP